METLSIGQRLWQWAGGGRSQPQGIKEEVIYTLSTFLHKFSLDSCSLWAAGLTFYTLVSIVPVFAIIFAIAKGFNLHEALRVRMIETLPEHTEVLNQVILIADRMIATADERFIANVSLLVLLLGSLGLLFDIDRAVSTIWNVRRPRPLVRKIVDYVSFMVLAPAAFLASGGLMVFLSTNVKEVLTSLGLSYALTPIILTGLQGLAYALLWLALLLLYLFIPYRRVRILPASIASAIAVVAYLAVQQLYITSQSHALRLGAIYGSFASIPLFFIWLKISWQIILAGATLGYVIQEGKSEVDLGSAAQTSPVGKKHAALLLTHCVVDHFVHNRQPPSLHQLSTTLGICPTLVRPMLRLLVRCHLLSKVVVKQKIEVGYQPARPVNTITLGAVLTELENLGEPLEATQNYQAVQELSHTLERLYSFKGSLDAQLPLSQLPTSFR